MGREPEGLPRLWVVEEVPLEVLESFRRSDCKPVPKVGGVSPTVGKQHRKTPGSKPVLFKPIEWCPLHARPCNGSTASCGVRVPRCRRYTKIFPNDGLNGFNGCVLSPPSPGIDRRKASDSSSPPVAPLCAGPFSHSSSRADESVGSVVLRRPATWPLSGNACSALFSISTCRQHGVC